MENRSICLNDAEEKIKLINNINFDSRGCPLLDIVKKVRKLNLTQDVIFTCRRTDIQALLSAMDIFVLPSYFEGIPVSVMEARAAVLSCFVSDTVTRSVNFLIVLVYLLIVQLLIGQML